MGVKDIVTKDYAQDSIVVADAFNKHIYKGKQVIKPENLKPLDTGLTGIPYGSDGAGEWDGPMSLHEMLSVQNPEILSYVSDYKLNLIAPGRMTDEEIDQFQTSLREVMLFIKYSKDKAKLDEMVQKDERFRNMDRKAATVISTVTGVEIEENYEEDKVDMCQALKEMMEDATKEGAQEIARRMLKEGSFSLEIIAKMTELSLEEVKALVAELSC